MTKSIGWPLLVVITAVFLTVGLVAGCPSSAKPDKYGAGTIEVVQLEHEGKIYVLARAWKRSSVDLELLTVKDVEEKNNE